MFRAFLYLIVFVLALSVLRSVLGIISKAFKWIVQQFLSAGGSPGSRPSSPPSGGELKKDPVCGTFISTATAFQKSVGGQTVYFCSTQCRDKYKG